MTLFSMIRRSSTSTLFPYTTLFRSRAKNQRMDTANKKAKTKLKTCIPMGKKCEVSIPNTRQMENLTTVKLMRSEEHTSELQSQSNLVCRLLLEKKKRQTRRPAALDD